MSEESRMKKTIIRIAVCVVVFLASALIIGSIMNQGHNNMTMEMAPATLPMITMESGGVACNELHGNTVEMDVAYQKDCITLLGEGRQANFTVDTFGREITGISTEVRSIDGSRLIENSEVTGWKANGKSFSVSLTLKDLIDTNTQYSLTLILELEGEQKVYYYTTILWNDDVHISEILEFATDFHGKLYDKEVAKELETLARVQPGEPAPDFAKEDVNGKPFRLSDLRGKYVVIDFWASWCVPCRKSNPHMKEMYAKWHDKGLEYVYVADNDSNPDNWRKAIKEDGLEAFHHVLRGLKVDRSNGGYKFDRTNDISEKYAIHFLPTKYLIDREGKIVGKFESDELEAKLKEIFE